MGQIYNVFVEMKDRNAGGCVFCGDRRGKGIKIGDDPLSYAAVQKELLKVREYLIHVICRFYHKLPSLHLRYNTITVRLK